MASCSIPAKETEDENETKTVPNWLELLRDITVNILKRLDTIEIVTSACLVCPLWWKICKDPLVWRTIRMCDLETSYYDLVDICRYAVERSSGNLESIYVECFATDDLLKYIADNANKLQHMRVVRCWRISDKGLSEAVRKLPQLVALDISMCNLSKDSLEVVGRSCPLLKLLKFVRTEFGYFEGVVDDEDDEAFVIAETMSGLSHLIIKGNKLTNVGLIAILDKCPHLEFLDIQRCYNLDLSESLKKRCQEQIKDLRLSTVCNTSEDYEDYDDHVSYRDSVIDDDCYDPYDPYD